MSIADKLKTIAENEQKVYDAGKQAEYDAFWDEFQNYGNPMGYSTRFAYEGWTDKNFNPKYKIYPESCNQLFNANTAITNIDVDIDLTLPSLTQAFYMFDGCKNLKRIKKIISKETISHASNYNQCTALEELNIEGVIGRNVDLHWSSLLNRESIESIMRCLSSTAEGYTVTLSEAAVNNAFTTEEWQELIANKTNWTLSLV